PLTVFSPHLYNESITLVTSLPSIEDGFRIAESAAAYYGRPLWTGEWGWFGDGAAGGGKGGRFVAAEHADQGGGARGARKSAWGAGRGGGGGGGGSGGGGGEGARGGRLAGAETADGVGGAWWSWRWGCGAPHYAGEGRSHKPLTGNLNRYSCPDGTYLGQDP